MGIEFDDRRIVKELKGIIDRSKNLKKPMSIIAMDMKKTVQNNIDKEQSFDGKKWKKSKRALRENGITLKDTGRLYNSLTVGSGKNYARTGTNVEYSRRLNDGDPKTRLPAYQYMGFSKDMEKKYTDIIQNYIINNKV